LILKRLIQDFFNLISIIKPAVICGYNSEDFDFNFILGAAGERLDIDINKKGEDALKTTMSEYHVIKKISSTVKFGNKTENYDKTVMWGYSVIDILHAVKRTAAINTEIKSQKLKEICKYEGIAKPNRMYIKGDEIGDFWKNNEVFYINKICKIVC